MRAGSIATREQWEPSMRTGGPTARERDDP